MGAIPVFPLRSNSVRTNPEFSRVIYRRKHLVENLLALIRRYLGPVTRFENLTTKFVASVNIAYLLIWVKSRPLN